MVAATIYIRDPTFQRAAQLDEYSTLEVIPRFNAVGSWQLTLNRAVAKSVLLNQPGYGIEIVSGGATILSGPVVDREHTVGADTNELTLTGASDDIWLRRRWAHAAPSESTPPYTTQAYDTRTGICSTVLRAYVNANLGLGAITTRRLTGVTLAADPLLGPSVKGRARFNNLLEFLQGLAVSGGGLGFRLIQASSGIEFQVYQPTDKSSTIKFSIDLGNLASYSYQAGAPEANYVIAGGSGEGTARTFKEGSDSASIAEWGRIEADLADRRDTTDSDELQQEITERLSDSTSKTSLSITPLDTEQMAYGTHYGLGDRVSVVIDDTTITEVIREVKFSFTPDGRTVQPQIGAPNQQSVLRLFRRIDAFRRRLSTLERR